MSALTMTVTEAAERLGVTPQWLRINAANGTVPSRKVGRYRRFTDADLTEYLDRVREGGSDPFARSTASRARRRRAS